MLQYFRLISRTRACVLSTKRGLDAWVCYCRFPPIRSVPAKINYFEHKFVFLGQISNSGYEVVVSCGMQILCYKSVLSIKNPKMFTKKTFREALVKVRMCL